MIRFTTAVVWLATASLLLGLACGKDSGTAPQTTGGGGGGGGGGGVAYTMPDFFVERSGFNQESHHASDAGYVVVGERGIALQALPAGRVALPTQSTIRLTDAWMSPTGAIYVVGSKTSTAPGLVLRYKDGKRTNLQISGLEGDVTAVSGISDDVWFLTTSEGQIYFYDGTGFSLVYTTVPLYDISASPSGLTFAAGAGGIYSGIGPLWATVLTAPSKTFTGISALAFDKVLAVADGEIWESSGNTFAKTHDAVGRLRDVNWGHAGYAVAVGGRGMTSTFNGTDWLDWVIPSQPDLKSVAAGEIGPGDFADAVGDSGAWYASDGTVWDGGVSPKTDWTDLMGTSVTRIYGIRGGKLMHHGDVWEPVEPAATMQLSKLWCVADDDIWAIAKHDIDTFATHYNGSSWTTSWLSSMDAPVDIWAAPDGYAFAAGPYGTVYQSRPSWAPHSAINPYQHLRAIWGVSQDNVYTAGENGTICHWNGTIWTPMVSGTAVHLNAIHGSASNNIVAVGDHGVVLRYNGTGWVVLHSGTNLDLTMVWTDRPDNIWAASSDGNVVRYNGLTYDVMTTGLPQLQHSAIWGTSGANVRIGAEDDFMLKYYRRP